MDREIVALELVGDWKRAVDRAAQHRQHGVRQEHQLAARAKQPERLWDPDERVGPERSAILADGEVKGLIAHRNVLGVCLDQGDGHLVLGCEPQGCSELAIRKIEANHPGPAACHPRRDVAGTTPEFDGVHAGHVWREQTQLGLGDPPDPPPRFEIGSPGLFAECHPVVGHVVPVVAVDPHVLR